MTVYVDDVELPFGNMLMCHMWSDAGDEELLAMADTIGVARRWIQGHPKLSIGRHRHASWVHFDVAKGNKKRAIKAGAVLTDRYGPVEHTAKLDIASGDAGRIARGTRMLGWIANSRDLARPIIARQEITP